MWSVTEAIQFYKWIWNKIFNNISFKDLIIKLLCWIIILILINSFQNIASYIFSGIIQEIINIFLILDIILIIWKIIYNIIQYKTNTFDSEEEKQAFKKNQISYSKESIYWFLQIGLWWFIITFVYYWIEINVWDSMTNDNTFWGAFSSIVIFIMMSIDANIIIFSNLYNRYKKAYLINYILFPTLFLLMIIVYLNLIS